jgi:hypothetical protein
MSDPEVIPGQPPESASPVRGVHSVHAVAAAAPSDAARDHVPVLLVILPWTADLDGPRMPQITEIEWLAAEWGRDRPDFRVLDAYAPFLAAKQRGEDLFLPVDRHFTPAAHRLTGDLLAERIRAILEDPKEPPR